MEPRPATTTHGISEGFVTSYVLPGWVFCSINPMESLIGKPLLYLDWPL